MWSNLTTKHTPKSNVIQPLVQAQSRKLILQSRPSSLKNNKIQLF